MSKTGTVTVTSPKRRKVYLNGDYDPSNSQTSECTFTVEFGPNTFETVNGDDKIDHRGEVVTNAGNKNSKVELVPVDPPEAK